MYERKFQLTLQIQLLTWVEMEENIADKKACNSSSDFWFNEFLYGIQCRYTKFYLLTMQFEEVMKIKTPLVQYTNLFVCVVGGCTRWRRRRRRR